MRAAIIICAVLLGLALLAAGGGSRNTGGAATVSGGFPPGADLGLDAAQAAQAARALTVADQVNADTLAVLAMVVAALGESNFRPVPNGKGSGYAGVFQADPKNIPMEDTEEQARSFLLGGKGFQGGGAMFLAEGDSTLTPGTIATRVEASGEPPSFYDAHRDHAERIIAAWNAGASLASPLSGAGIDDLVAEANRMISLNQPYLWGGGHAAFDSNGRWDCSGAMSWLMHYLGLLKSPTPLDSTGFMGEGAAGRGQLFTIYANPDHVFLIVEVGEHAGQSWGTANRSIGTRAPTSGGPTWHIHATDGFTARHYAGF